MINIITIIFLFVLVLNEYHWYTRKKYWIKGKGTVIRFRDTAYGPAKTSYKPVVEWQYNGEARQFTSAYSLGDFSLGQEVAIFFAPDGNAAEIYNFRNRSFVSILAILISLLSIAIAKA
ncbi:MAG TPA: DUF3592 domain-containing protein [Cellvibrio sp.]|nr:DUF3592 domain-containing protein [Cellvibrio sp.]